MLNNKGFVIDKSNLSENEISDLKTKLTISPIVGDYTPVHLVPKIKVYREGKKTIRVPRYFGIDNINPEPEINITNGIPIDVLFKGVLNDKISQTEAANKALTHLKQIGNGILSLPTGYGKTTIALYIISKMKTRTMIIVHKHYLLNQWLERISQFLPDAKVGFIQGKNVDVIGKDIVIVMLQSVAMKKYDDNIYDGFGLTVIDEAHHICAKVFSKALFNICTKHMLGLSATPDRKDGLTKILKWFLNDVFYYIERKEQQNVTVKKIQLGKEFYGPIPFPVNKLNKVSLPEAINMLTENGIRNNIIISQIEKELEQENSRNILILSDRRIHCKLMKENIENLLRNKCSTKKVGLYLGGMKPEELKKSEDCDIIIGTYSLAHEGLDIPKLDTLILSTPKSDIVQSVGRILRETTTKKNDPLVIDIVDMWGIFEYQYYKRQKFYKKTGFLIKESCVNM